jgi:hypothetical protein
VKISGEISKKENTIKLPITITSHEKIGIRIGDNLTLKAAGGMMARLLPTLYLYCLFRQSMSISKVEEAKVDY